MNINFQLKRWLSDRTASPLSLVLKNVRFMSVSLKLHGRQNACR